MKNKRMIANIVEILAGIILLILGGVGIVDSFWNGMGSAFLFIGILQLIKSIKYNTDKEYKEKVDVEINDERNKYLSLKAWAWSGYLFVLIAAVVCIVFKIMKLDDLSLMASSGVCLIITLYWIIYLILRKKY